MFCCELLMLGRLAVRNMREKVSNGTPGVLPGHSGITPLHSYLLFVFILPSMPKLFVQRDK